MFNITGLGVLPIIFWTQTNLRFRHHSWAPVKKIWSTKRLTFPGWKKNPKKHCKVSTIIYQTWITLDSSALFFLSFHPWTVCVSVPLIIFMTFENLSCWKVGLESHAVCKQYLSGAVCFCALWLNDIHACMWYTYYIMTHDYIFHVHEPYTAVNFCRLPAATAVIPPPNTASLDVETYADRTLQYLQCACTGLGKSNHLSLGYWIMMRVHPFRTILNL